MAATCKGCGKAFTKHNINAPQVFCSRSCSSRWVLLQPDFQKKFYTAARGNKIRESRRKTFAADPERYEAMREAQSRGMEKYMNSLTPQQKEKRRKNMSRILREIGHKPPMRGGNGTGPTAAEQVLLEAFPKSQNNYAVRTGMKAGSGYPTHYKVDVAFPAIKLAIEADGNSHKVLERKEQDVKKTDLLTDLGWTVLRFVNKRILEDTKNVLTEIRSVEGRLSGCR